MWKMPEIILISRGNSELLIGLLLQVYSWVVYSVPIGKLSEGLRYLKKFIISSCLILFFNLINFITFIFDILFLFISDIYLMIARDIRRTP
jgi:hypothetical protein